MLPALPPPRLRSGCERVLTEEPGKGPCVFHHDAMAGEPNLRMVDLRDHTTLTGGHNHSVVWIDHAFSISSPMR
jgi:hypothetical protein